MNCDTLQRKLYRNSSYRKREISNLTMQIQATDGEIKQALLRAAFTLVYAHFEGFSKEAIRLFLKHINSQQIPIYHLDYYLQTLYHTKKIIDIKQSNRKTKFNELTTAILVENNNLFRVEERDKDIVSTDSNLRFDIIEELLFIIGVKTEQFILISDNQTSIATKEEFINRNFIDTRNKIAHGENTEVTLIHFEEVKSFVVTFIDTLAEYIIDVSKNKLYLIPS